MMTKSFKSENLEIVVHPAVQHKLLRLRDVNTGEFVDFSIGKHLGRKGSIRFLCGRNYMSPWSLQHFERLRQFS